MVLITKSHFILTCISMTYQSTDMLVFLQLIVLCINNEEKHINWNNSRGYKESTRMGLFEAVSIASGVPQNR